MIYVADYVNYSQAKMLERLGFDKDCEFFHLSRSLTLVPYHDTLVLLRENPKKYRSTVCRAPRLTEAAKFMREDLGIDIVVQPRFDSKTGERKGYFWRWPQRTDVNMNPKVHKRYEAALSDALTVILKQITPTNN